MAPVLDPDPILVVSDVDDDDTLGPSDLFRSTMSPELNQYEDSAPDKGEYYLGHDLDYLSGPCIAAGLIDDDDAVWVATAHGLIRSWSAQGAVERDVKYAAGAASPPLSAAAFVRDGWALGDSAGRVRIVNQFAETRADLTACRHDDLVSHMTAASGGAGLITASWDGAVHVVDLGQYAQLAHQYQPCRCPVEYVLAAGPALIWAAAADGRARLLDVRARDCVQAVRGDDGAVTPVRCLALAGAGTATLYMAHGQGQLAAIDLRMGRPARRYFGHDDVVNRILVRADRLISAGDDRQIRIFDVNDCISIDKLGGHHHALTDLAVLDTALISADAEGAVRRYDLETVERFHVRRVAEREDEKKARDLIAAQQAMTKTSSKTKKSKKGSKKKKKKK